MKLNRNPLLFPCKERFCTDKNIGNIDDIWTQRTWFSKIQEHFGVIMLL